MTGVKGFLSANWVAIVIGVAGIIATFFVYARTRRVKRPMWSVHTTDLVTRRTTELTGLGVTYNGQPVSDLSISRIVVFNAGNDPIRRQDIAPAAPLALAVPKGVTILAATLVAANNAVNRVELRFGPDENRALVEFDYLARDEGAVFDVVHDGGTEPTALVTGVVIGAAVPRYTNVTPRHRSNQVIAWIFGAMAIALILYFLQQELLADHFVWEGLLLLVLAGGFGGVSLSILRERHVPPGLGAFYERRYRTESPSKRTAHAPKQ